ncbi:TRAP transporter substrate-binding protein [Enterovirga rhinocerotis]|uniref:TRAP-type C4-dicarboxylate transport system substrate-binding protein n=1 Tax=Enterovirga rhinocerotis TaxID=1339210 RepID=A0A4R7BXU0_9HYPH|nr:TRAP transporter substrate-binding protein [Enterovirga rhinocerotis]TDR90052.1 TRAP-type C4-dicarboxylate transport system substrate-binding protein [Enterovirga rhinocerotis]
MRRLLIAILVCLAGGAEAQTVWRMPTEYPATAMPGEGIASFASSLARRSGGRLAIEPSFDAKLGIKSAAMPVAIREGRVEAGDAFGGALGGIDPVFGLSSLPFVTPSIEAAERLAGTARPLYAQAFAKQGQRLLYVTPWPPSGLWMKEPLASVETLRGLAVRTYDATSTAVMARAGAKAFNISFADAQARVKDGSVNAVLSSGDGGAGRRLWEQLPHFAEINYAIPLSFATVSQKAYEALDPDLRRAVDEAAAETESRQWAAIRTRLDENYKRMRENGVTIRTGIDPAVTAALREAGAASVVEWRKVAGPEAGRLVDGLPPK